MEAVLDEGREAKDEGRVEEALTLFIEAIELSEGLEIVGTSETDEALVIRDWSKAEGIEGAYVEVSIAEIIKNTGLAHQIICVINNERKPVVLHGVTRIVGYYSRMHNWNKSKVGELRDRAQRNYGLTAESPRFDAERMNAINSL